MKYKSLYIVPAILFSLASCSESKDNPDSPDNGDTHAVTFSTEVTLNTKAPLITELADGERMNVYVKAFGSIDAKDLVSDVYAENKGGTWKMVPEVRISKDQNAFIFAAWPWQADAADPKAIPVDVTRQEDVLYSGQFVPASYTTNHVTLKMKHALSMLTVNIKKDGYGGEGVLSAMKLSGGDAIVTNGTMNVSSGKITATKSGELSVGGLSAAMGSNGFSGALPSMWVVPFSSKDRNDVSLTLTIDGKDYKVVLPEVAMHTGWQYVFHGIMTSNGLVLIPDATEEYALNRQDDTVGNLEGHGVIRFTVTSPTFTFPAFTGDNVFGNIIAASGPASNYTIGGILEGLKSPETVTVETWNTHGFEIHSFEGIESIDLSEY